MLKIFYGRENVDKAKFIFENIGTKALLLVPNQFTLEAEKDAIKYMASEGIMDLEILSMSRLGFRVLAELGGTKKTMIDKYGRHMLLSRIISKLEDDKELTIYRGFKDKSAFIDMTNDFISEMKQYSTTPDDLEIILEQVKGEVLLSGKLKDIHKIYQAYEDKIQDKFVDTEDYIDMFLPKIRQSKLVKENEIWVWGFDYFTPKNMEILRALIETTDVNVVMTGSSGGRDDEIFKLTEDIMNQLIRAAEETKIKFCKVQISEDYAVKTGYGENERNPAIAAIERELYASSIEPYMDQCTIKMVEAANYYTEAETAAVYVTELVRDKGLRLRDTVIICNDLETRGSIIKRVFEQYNLPVFADKKRNIMHNPVVIYILSLIDIVAKGYRTKDILAFLKTGLTDIDEEQIENIENYAVKYRIRGNLWKEPFKKGHLEYSDYELAEIEATRKDLMSFILLFSEEFKKNKKVKERITALYIFLRDEAMLPAHIENFIIEKENKELFEIAKETQQIWAILVNIFEQMAELLGEENMAMEKLNIVLRAGIEAVEIGVLPPTVDGLILGTMQRTRTADVKALIIIGANDGLLPSAMNTEGLLSEDEKNRLFNKEIKICKIDELRAREEKLAIYRAISKVEKYLFISYAASDTEGKEQKPSRIFTTIKNIFPAGKIEKDICNNETIMDLIQTKDSTLNHMANALRKSVSENQLDQEWQDALAWYKEEDNDELQRVLSGLLYKNHQEDLKKSIVNRLYIRDGNGLVTVSPSRIERFSRCPFSHFITYGLRPEERRIYETSNREIGDIYHQCLMRLSEKLTEATKNCTTKKISEKAEEVLDEGWYGITREKCDQTVVEILLEEAKKYREGLLFLGLEEEYRYSRIKEILCQVAWILVEHVRAGKIKEMSFETEFGKSKTAKLGPIEVETSEGTVQIEGKIDRVDILEGDTVKVIDYKSGNEAFDVAEAVGGFRLQLMLYLKAAQFQQKDNINSKFEPAGIFYFLIKESDIDGDGMTKDDIAERLSVTIKKDFKMNGLIVNNPGVIENIAGEFGQWSDIVGGLKRVKDKENPNQYIFQGSGFMESEDFQLVQGAFDEKIKELCKGLLKGEISAHPMKAGSVTACTYCQYKSICKFDTLFSGCTYNKIIK